MMIIEVRFLAVISRLKSLLQFVYKQSNKGKCIYFNYLSTFVKVKFH